MLIQIFILQVVFGLGDPDNTIEQQKKASIWTVVVTNAFTVVGVSLYFFFNS